MIPEYSVVVIRVLANNYVASELQAVCIKPLNVQDKVLRKYWPTLKLYVDSDDTLLY